MKRNKGVTLVALIITVIILMILAVVAINSVNNTGIIQHAQNAKLRYEEKEDEQQQILQEYMEYLNPNNSTQKVFAAKLNYNAENDNVILSFILRLSDDEVIKFVSDAIGDASITDIDSATIAIIKELAGTDYEDFEAAYGDESVEKQFEIGMEYLELDIKTVNEFVGRAYLVKNVENLQLTINGNDIVDQIEVSGLEIQYKITKNGTYNIELIIDDKKYSDRIVVSEISGDIIRIGESIEYSAGGVNDWKVFYKNENYVYIITSGYLENRLLPSGLNMTGSGTYAASWESHTDIISQNGAQDITKEVAQKFMLNWWNEERINNRAAVRAVADLLNTQIWSASFGDLSRGIEAVGAPTIDMWRASWIKKGYGDFTISYDENGYYYGSIQTALVNLSNKKGSKDQLYFPSIDSDDGIGNYWLASNLTNSYWGDAGLYIAAYIPEYGAVLSSGDYTSDVGIRPVVAVPINLVERNSEQVLVVN